MRISGCACVYTSLTKQINTQLTSRSMDIFSSIFTPGTDSPHPLLRSVLNPPCHRYFQTWIYCLSMTSPLLGVNDSKTKNSNNLFFASFFSECLMSSDITRTLLKIFFLCLSLHFFSFFFSVHIGFQTRKKYFTFFLIIFLTRLKRNGPVIKFHWIPKPLIIGDS